MMTFLLLELTSSEAVYECYPEDKIPAGVIAIDRATGEWKFIEKGKELTSIYAGMIWHLVKRLMEKGEFPKKTMVACW